MRRRAKNQSFVCEIGKKLYQVRINTFSDAEALHRQVGARNRLLRRRKANPRRKRK